MKLLLPTVILLGVTACTGGDEPEAQATAGAQAEQPAWPVSPDSSVAVTRKAHNGDLDAALADLSGDARQVALDMVAGAKQRRLEAAEWLGKAIATEKQAREYTAAGDEQGAGRARETAAGYRQRAQEKLARARADEARVLALAREAGADDGARPAGER